MRCIPQEEPHRTVYFIFLLMVHSMILRHDFLACITAYNTRWLAFCSNVQNCLYDVTGRLGQIELMYSLRDSLPACFSLPWLFIMIQITSIIMYHCPSLACFSSKGITCSASPGSPSFSYDDIRKTRISLRQLMVAWAAWPSISRSLKLSQASKSII